MYTGNTRSYVYIQFNPACHPLLYISGVRACFVHLRVFYIYSSEAMEEFRDMDLGDRS